LPFGTRRVVCRAPKNVGLSGLRGAARRGAGRRGAALRGVGRYGARDGDGAQVTAMLNAPFGRTVYLDFDSRPCVADFVRPLLEALAAGPRANVGAARDENDTRRRVAEPSRPRLYDGGGGADIALTNKRPGQRDGRETRHLKHEHNSACVVLDMRSARTRSLLALYADACVLRRRAVSRSSARRSRPFGASLFAPSWRTHRAHLWRRAPSGARLWRRPSGWAVGKQADLCAACARPGSRGSDRAARTTSRR
jgi:hypothetical protein